MLTAKPPASADYEFSGGQFAHVQFPFLANGSRHVSLAPLTSSSEELIQHDTLSLRVFGPEPYVQQLQAVFESMNTTGEWPMQLFTANLAGQLEPGKTKENSAYMAVLERPVDIGLQQIHDYRRAIICCSGANIAALDGVIRDVVQSSVSAHMKDQ